jgi:hypothetical protein
LSSALQTKGYDGPDAAGNVARIGGPQCPAAAGSQAPDADVRGSGDEGGDAGRAGRARPGPRACGDLPFLIKRDGTWLYRGSPIGRKELVCLFSSVLKRDAEGEYWLETPVERGRIQVEETPWVAVELNWGRCCQGPAQCLTFRTNVDQVVTAGPEHPIRVSYNALTAEPTPYILIRQEGGAPLEARIGRAVYYELVALAVPGCNGGRKCLGVWSSNMFFPLGDLPACGG